MSRARFWGAPNDMLSLLNAVGRLIFRAAVVLVLLALLLGRYAPARRDARSDEVRTTANPRYRPIRSCYFSDRPDVPRILDAETGALTPCSLPGAEGLDLLGCSPWRDGAGQHHMLARSRSINGCRPENFPGPIELLRLTLPAAQVVGRFPAVEPEPMGLVCWAPDRSDLFLFAAGDGRLYRYDFPRGDDARGDGGARPEPLRWRGETRETDLGFLQDPCWPRDPALGARILVALVARDTEDARQSPPSQQLWWLELDPDVSSVVAAGRLIVPGGQGSAVARREELLPAVGRADDGAPLLAYLARSPEDATWELWVAPIVPAAAGGAPRVLASSGQRLAEGCAAVAPTFSPDGRWIFAASHDARSGLRMRRFEVTAACAGDRRHSPDVLDDRGALNDYLARKSGTDEH